MKSKLKVGQSVVAATNEFGEGIRLTDCKIITVGQYYFYTDMPRCNKISIKTLIIHGGKYSSPGYIYLSRAAYHQQENEQIAWEKLRYKLASFQHQYTKPKNLTIEHIEEIIRLLELDSEI